MQSGSDSTSAGSFLAAPMAVVADSVVQLGGNQSNVSSRCPAISCVMQCEDKLKHQCFVSRSPISTDLCMYAVCTQCCKVLQLHQQLSS